MGFLGLVNNLICHCSNLIKFKSDNHFVLLILAAPLLSGCQISYLIKNAYNQMGLLNSRIPIEKALQDDQLTDIQKKKLMLAKRAHEFAETKLSLVKSKNYTTFVKLDRPYVTWTVSVAEKWKLVPYHWSFPIVGKVPYKGYFNEPAAQTEADEYRQKGYDVYVRGVSAYSTLGWFRDPVLSSMLNYSDYDLVNTIIHETLHATLFIKSDADFNEQLATFVGNKGAEEFFLATEGSESEALKIAKIDNADDKLFADFISAELRNLESWYLQLPELAKTQAGASGKGITGDVAANNKIADVESTGQDRSAKSADIKGPVNSVNVDSKELNNSANSDAKKSNGMTAIKIQESELNKIKEELKQSRISLIQKRFIENVKPKMRGKSYDKFADLKLNNARLLLYKTYMNDLSQIESVFTKFNGDWAAFISHCKTNATDKTSLLMK